MAQAVLGSSPASAPKSSFLTHLCQGDSRDWLKCPGTATHTGVGARPPPPTREICSELPAPALVSPSSTTADSRGWKIPLLFKQTIQKIQPSDSPRPAWVHPSSPPTACGPHGSSQTAPSASCAPASEIVPAPQLTPFSGFSPVLGKGELPGSPLPALGVPLQGHDGHASEGCPGGS